MLLRCYIHRSRSRGPRSENNPVVRQQRDCDNNSSIDTGPRARRAFESCIIRSRLSRRNKGGQRGAGRRRKKRRKREGEAEKGETERIPNRLPYLREHGSSRFPVEVEQRAVVTSGKSRYLVVLRRIFYRDRPGPTHGSWEENLVPAANNERSRPVYESVGRVGTPGTHRGDTGKATPWNARETCGLSRETTRTGQLPARGTLQTLLRGISPILGFSSVYRVSLDRLTFVVTLFQMRCGRMARN